MKESLPEPKPDMDGGYFGVTPGLPNGRME